MNEATKATHLYPTQGVDILQYNTISLYFIALPRAACCRLKTTSRLLRDQVMTNYVAACKHHMTKLIKQYKLLYGYCDVET